MKILITSVTFAFSAAENEQTMLQLFSQFLSLENREVTSSKIHSGPTATADCRKQGIHFGYALTCPSEALLLPHTRSEAVQRGKQWACSASFRLSPAWCVLPKPLTEEVSIAGIWASFFPSIYWPCCMHFPTGDAENVWGQARHGWGAQPVLSVPRHSMEFLPLSPDQQPPLPTKSGSKGVLTAALLADQLQIQGRI